MNPDREELLFQLSLLKPAAERGEFLDRECADDSALRRRLEALLAAHGTLSIEGILQVWQAPSWEEIKAAEAKDGPSYESQNN